MPQIKNLGRTAIDFVVKGGKVTDGVPETVSLPAGETASIDVDTDGAHYKGLVAAGVIEGPSSGGGSSPASSKKASTSSQ